jgi:hypothetical protein
MSAVDTNSPLAECPKAELYRIFDMVSALAAEFEADGGYGVSLGQVWEQVCAELDRRA